MSLILDKRVRHYFTSVESNIIYHRELLNEKPAPTRDCHHRAQGLVYRKYLPDKPHGSDVNPQIGLEHSSFRLHTAALLRPWPNC